MRITALAGGIGGARFLRGLLHHLQRTPDLAGSTVTVISNTGDDITLHGLRICPDIDSVLYTLGGVGDGERGWGRADETYHAQEELTALGSGPAWFTLGDRDLGVHIARSQLLGLGHSLSAVTARLADRFGMPQRGVTVLPMSDTPVETHVVVDLGEGPTAIHFQQWWVEYRAAVPAQRFVLAGLERAQPAPGVLEAIREADVVLLPPSNPVVSIGIILTVPGVREALRETSAPVVGVSPIVAGMPVRGHADACLAAIGVPCTAMGVAGLYADFLDGWLIAPDDVPQVPAGSADSAGGPTGGPTVLGAPLLMSSLPWTADLAGAALNLAAELRRADR